MKNEYVSSPTRGDNDNGYSPVAIVNYEDKGVEQVSIAVLKGPPHKGYVRLPLCLHGAFPDVRALLSALLKHKTSPSQL